MTLGAGCWAPGIIWDAENSAAFKGPRAGVWPYTSPCSLAAKNALALDPYTGKLWIPPPVNRYPYRQTWDTTNAAATPQPNALLFPGSGSTPIQVSGASPQIVIPAPACGWFANFHERVSLSVDVLLGSDSWLQITQGGTILALIDNSGATANTAQAVDSIPSGSGGITPIPGTWTTHSPFYHDEPWGSASTGLNSAAGCIAFDGTATYVRSPVMTTMNWAGDWTIGVWVRALSTGVGGVYAPVWSFGNTAQANLWLGFAWTSGNASFGLHTAPINGSYSNDAVYTFADATFTSHWYHVVVTHTGSTNKVSMYVNGVQQVSAVTLVNSIWTTTASSMMQYGCAFEPSSVTILANAMINNGMVYPRILTGTEITAMYTNPANSGLLPTGAVSWLKMNDGMNRQRIVETVQIPATQTGTDATPATMTRTASLGLTPGGTFNPCLVNSWSLTLDGYALSPNA